VILKAGELSVDECVQQLVHLLATRVSQSVFSRPLTVDKESYTCLPKFGTSADMYIFTA